MASVVLTSGDHVSNMGVTAHCCRRYQSWKQFWIHNSHRPWPNQCCIAYCTFMATDGAHVMIMGRQENYLIPTCQNCHSTRLSQWLPVKTNTVAVRIFAWNTVSYGFPYQK